MDTLLISMFPMLTAYFLTIILTKRWINAARKFGIVGKDMNKYDKRLVAEAGGVNVIISIAFGFMLYIFLKKYFFGSETHLIETLSLISILLLSGFIGFTDDILGWKKGLKPWEKVLSTFALAIPLMVIKAGTSVISLPIIGTVDLGLLFPLILVPIGIVGTANGFNILAGFNGMETGMGILLFSALALKFWQTNQLWLAYLSLIVIFSLIAFLIYNWYPAKVFPGDSLTYGIGALFGAFVILGNAEKFGIILFTLYFIKFFMFLYFKLKGHVEEDFGVPNPDNSLEVPGKVYCPQHAIIVLLKKLKGKVYEYEVTLTLLALQILITIIAFLLV